jgi:hypothetical protein
MPDPKHEQISLTEYQDEQAKKGKRRKLIDLPWPVKLIFAIPFVFFIILLLGYLLFIRRYAAHG